MAILTSSSNRITKKRFSLQGKKVTIGRHPECDIHIDDSSVSRMHAVIDYRNDCYYLEDLDSRNGTFINQSKVSSATKLYDGVEVKICDVVLNFYLNDEPQVHIEKPTAADQVDSEEISRRMMLQSIVLKDLEPGKSDSQVAKIDVSSHYQPCHQHVSAEEKLRTLLRVAQVLSESLERDEVLSRILDFLFEHFTEADRGFIILKSADGSLLPLGCKTRRPHDEEQIQISKTIINQVMETRRPIISSDASSDDRFDLSQSIVDFRIRSMMCAPLINSQDESIGVVQLDTLRPSIVFSEEDLELFATIAMQASLTIQKADLFAEAKRAREIRQDLALANELQSRFLPQDPPKVAGYEFSSFYRPMQQVGGDYFDYIELDDDHLAVIVADVVGHGIAAAMLMAKVSAESRFALATTKSAAAAMERLNDKLTDMHLNRFVTLVLCLINTKTHTVEVVNAGHMPPIVRVAKTGDLTELSIEESGVPVGVISKFKYETSQLNLAPGDVVILYTDGINEAMDAQDKQLTTAHMLAEVSSSQAKTPTAINKIIVKEANRHMGNIAPIDDMCLVCFGRTVKLRPNEATDQNKNAAKPVSDQRSGPSS